MRILLSCLVLLACSCSRPGRVVVDDPDDADMGLDGGRPPHMRYDFALDPTMDYDKDGYTGLQGDCNDTDVLVGPDAVEVVGNNVDDDCDGLVDETDPPCDSGLLNKNDAPALAAAMGLCDKRFLLSSMLTAANASATRVLPDYGMYYAAKEGAAVGILSSGVAARKNDSGYAGVQSGTNFGSSAPNPDTTVPTLPGCGQTSQPATVYDLTTLEVKLKVPQNAKSFSFTFAFDSAEYPEYVCKIYNDTFLAELQSLKYPKFSNISFDSANNPITVNNGLFTVCENWTTPQTMNCKRPGAELAGTGYEDSSGGTLVGGGTGWLTTTAPVEPGETITLRFAIFDEGDGILDSAVVLDNFVWSLKPAMGPITVP